MPVQLQPRDTDINATDNYNSLRTTIIDHLGSIVDPHGPSDTHLVHVKLTSTTGTIHATYTYRDNDHMLDLNTFRTTPDNTIEYQRRRVVPTRDTHQLAFLIDALSATGDTVTATVETITPDELNTPEHTNFTTEYRNSRGTTIN